MAWSPSRLVSYDAFGAMFVQLTARTDQIDDVLARFNDAGGFDELETVWFLIA